MKINYYWTDNSHDNLPPGNYEADCIVESGYVKETNERWFTFYISNVRPTEDSDE